MADQSRDGHEPPVVEKEPAYSVTVKDGVAMMPWKDFSTLTGKAALWDAYDAIRRRTMTEGELWLQDADIYFEQQKEDKK